MTIQILLARSETDLPKDGSQKRKVWREGNTGVILFRNGPSAYESICREKKHAAQVELTECPKVQEWELAGMFRGKGDDLIWVIVGNESRRAGESRVHAVQLYL